VSLVIQITQITSDFASSFKGAADFFNDLNRELIAMKTVLEQLESLLRTQSIIGSFTDTAALVTSTDFCNERLEKLLSRLKKLTEGGRLMRGLRALLWPYSEAENKQAVLGLHRYTRLFELSLTREGWYESLIMSAPFTRFSRLIIFSVK